MYVCTGVPACVCVCVCVCARAPRAFPEEERETREKGHAIEKGQGKLLLALRCELEVRGAEQEKSK